VSLNVEVL